jgi:hypothetical protein
MNFLSVLYAKAGITVDGVTTLNNTATALTPATNDNSTNIATTGFVKNQNYYPYPTGTTSQYVRGDGSLATFTQTGGGGSSVSYYLNGGTSQGTIGGNTYYEMSKTAVVGTNADFNINSNGYIAQFVTDAGDPALLNIPGGNWNFEMFFSASSGGGSPSFYVELYKYDGTTLTLIASGSAIPESITGGTSIDLYTTALAVPSTTLTLTDRLAVRVYVNHSGRTITLHTQNGHLCQVITTFTTGLTALNGLTAQVQNFAVGAGGTDFNISSVTDTHTFNLPTASATKRGALSSIDWSAFDAKVDFGDLSATSPLSYNGSGLFSIAQSSTSTNGYLSSMDWNTFNNKQDALTNPVTGTGTTNYVTKWISGSVVGNSIIYDNGTNVGIGTTSPSAKLEILGNDDQIILNTAGTYSSIYFRNNGTSVGQLFSTNAATYLTTIGSRILYLGGGNGVTQMTLDGTNVGIGTGSPTTKLQVVGGYISTKDDAAYGGAFMEGYNGIVYFGSLGTDNISLYSSGAERMRIFSDGNIAINSTTNAGYKLDVNGNGRFKSTGQILTLETTTARGSGSNYLSFVDPTGSKGYIGYGSGSTDDFIISNNLNANMLFYVNGSQRLSLASTGAATFSSSVTATSFNGNATTATNISNTGTVTLATATEANSIYITQPSYTTDTPVKLLNFAWYSDVWSMGNIRSGGAASNGFGIYLSGAEKVRIDTNGNLGLGTTSFNLPTTGRKILSISGTTSSLIEMQVGSGNRAYIYSDATKAEIYSYTKLDLSTNGAERISIQANGNVLINTTTDAGYKLDVNGTGRFVSSNNTTALTISAGSNATFEFKGNSTSGYASTFNINDTALYIGHNSAGRDLVLQTASVDRLTISGSGAATFSSSVTAVGALFTSSTETRGTIRTTFTGDNSYYSLFSNDGALTLDTYGVGGSIYLKILGSTKLIIAASGNLLLGTVTDSGYKLDVNGTARVVNQLRAYSLLSDTQIKGSAYVELSPDQGTYNAWNIRVGAQAADNCYYITGGGVNILTTEGYNNPYTVKLYSNGIQTLTMTNGTATFSSSVTANSFIKSGGTSAQFLKADGSLDSSVYLTSTSSTFSYTSSVTLSPTWQNTGVSSLNLGTGAYLVTCYANDFAVGGGQYNCTYAGIMYFYADTTNGSNANEIVLHHSGHADQGRYIYLRTLGTVVADGKTYLQISGNGTNSGASNYQLTFKKLL